MAEGGVQFWDGQGPLQGKTLRIATVQSMPLSGAELRGDGRYEGLGVAFEVVRLLERALNFSHLVLSPHAHQEDPLEALTHGEAHVVAALLPVASQLGGGVRHSTALASDNWVILMRRPEESASGTGLLAPFDTSVWLVTLAALLAMGPLIFSLLRARRRLCPPHASRSPRHVFPLSACVWFAYSAIMKQGSTLAPANDVSRLLFATWWVFITILTSFYTANLTAFLTLSRFTLPIEDARDLAEDSLRWVGRAGGALEHAITQVDELAYLRGSLQAGAGRILKLADQDILELVLAGHVYLGEHMAVERLVFRNYLGKAREGLDHGGRCQLVFTNKPFMVRPLAFAFPANSSLPALFNPVLRALVEGGVVRHALRLDLPTTDICPLNLGNSERQLRNSDLLATYLAVCAGFCAALTAFLVELLARRVQARQQWRQVIPSPPVLPHKRQLLLYPRDFTLPPVGKTALLMDPHLFIVHRALNVRVVKPFRKSKLAFTE